MATWLSLLSCFFLTYIIDPNESAIPSQEHLQHEIDVGIEAICSLGNDHENRGMLDEFSLNGGLYTLSMYYRFNEHKINHANASSSSIDLVDCIQTAISCLQSQSISVENGQLIVGNTGATSLAVMGMVELCITSHDAHALCQSYLNQFLSWIEGLMVMRRNKLKSDNYTLSKGAFMASLETVDEFNSVYDAQAYAAIARLIKYQGLLSQRMTAESSANATALWQQWTNMLIGLDTYYIEYADGYNNDTRWLLQAWFDRWVAFSANARGETNHFMDRYMVQHLMTNKANELWQDDRYRDTFLIDAYVDVLHAVQVSLNRSQYATEHDSDLYRFGDKVLSQIENNYHAHIEVNSLHEMVNVYCSLMKLYQFLYVNLPHTSYDFTMADNESVLLSFNARPQSGYDGRWLNYDSAMSLMGVLVVVVLLNGVCVYWCYYSKHHRSSMQPIPPSPSEAVLREPRRPRVPAIRVPALSRARSASANSFDATPMSEDANYFRDSFFETPDVNDMDLLNNNSFYKEYNNLYR